jgi:metallo-beta-lactamase class B
MPLRFLLAALALSIPLIAQNKDWDEPFPPHRIADNLYYVGTRGLSTYLITTSEGLILINPSFDRTVPLIRASVEKLGFTFSDVKLILNSHAHDDHVGGMALLKELTGAKVFVMEGDEKVIESGGRGQYLYKGRWKPVKIDRVLKDGDEVRLGDAVLKAFRTPGHTRGCTTWAMKAKYGGKIYDVVIVGSPNVNEGFRLVGNTDYPEIAADYAKSFKIWKSLPCDIFLGAHGSYYGMEAKYARTKKTGPNPWIDPAGYRAYIANREIAYLGTLKIQTK